MICTVGREFEQTIIICKIKHLQIPKLYLCYNNYLLVLLKHIPISIHFKQLKWHFILSVVYQSCRVFFVSNFLHIRLIILYYFRTFFCLGCWRVSRNFFCECLFRLSWGNKLLLFEIITNKFCMWCARLDVFNECYVWYFEVLRVN